MKLLFTLGLITFFCISSKAGFVIGYQGGIYVPSIANTQSTMYYYNQVYHANFHYNNFFKGIFLGYRIEDDAYWISLAWNKKQNIFTSEYLNSTNEKYKLSIKTRMNELVFDAGVIYENWGLGAGFNMSNLNVMMKRGKIADFSATKWTYDYGTPITIFGLPNNPSFCFILERHFGKLIRLRATYHFGIGEITFANDAIKTFYDFKPNNVTLAFLLNIGK